MEKPECLSRREFLKGAALLLPGMELLSACGTTTGLLPTASIARNASGIYTLDLNIFTALQSVGGTAHLSVNAASGTKDLYVTRLSAASCVAVTTQCTYGTCILANYDSNPGVYRCLCHGCVFSGTGAVVTGPATQALPSISGTVGATSIQFAIP